MTVVPVGPEAAEDVLAVIREAFGARPVLDPPADASAETLVSVRERLAHHGGLLALLDGAPAGPKPAQRQQQRQQHDDGEREAQRRRRRQHAQREHCHEQNMNTGGSETRRHERMPR